MYLRRGDIDIMENILNKITFSDSLFEKEVVGLKEFRTKVSDIFSRVTNDFEYIECGNVKKDSNETISIISTNALKEILKKYEFNPIVTEDKESKEWVVDFEEIQVTGFGDSLEDAILMCIDNIETLMEDFFENTSLYMRIENMKKKFPYYLRIKNCTCAEELLEILNFKKQFKRW